MGTMRTTLRLVAVAGLLSLGCVASAQAPAGEKPRDALAAEIVPPHWDTMRVGMDILTDGKPMRTLYHQGKTYLPVPRHGLEYQIRVWNHGPRRVVAIASVDGLTVHNGRPASEDHPVYIVAPRSHIVIKGWRRDKDSVAAFSFEERDKSYASQVGRPENIGVLGLIAIEEMTARPRPQPMEKRAAGPETAARDSLKEPGTVGGTGTGYGREIDSRIYYVPFVRSANKRTITMYYDTVENLRRAGVPVNRPMPVPFPADGEFVPPPPAEK